mgnify:CR=1 FL=1
MKIWLGTTTLHFKDYREYYEKIREHLLSLGHVLTYDWIGEYGDWIEENPNAERGINDVYQRVTHAMDNADASIIEFTVPNFSTSHQITYSLRKRKPTLVMRLEKDNTFQDSYIEALDSKYLTVTKYDLKNYKDIIDEFLGYAGLDKGKKRYNVILGKEHKFYLDWAANKYDKSRSEILRDLIEEMRSEDKNFKIYLKDS